MSKLPETPMEIANWKCPLRKENIGNLPCLLEGGFPVHGCTSEAPAVLQGKSENIRTGEMTTVCEATSGESQLGCYIQLMGIQLDKEYKGI